ncbi:MAG: hypothetical protein L3J91_03020, partial [Thermoplasmata archaeon]|nr:hypothetical protein [Thermoplasmata archaeon]
MTTQYELALDRANEVRLATAAIRAQIASAPRRESAYRAAHEVERAEASMTFYRLLRTVRGIGDQTAQRMLAATWINANARVTSPRVPAPQRARLVGLLIAHGEGSG